MGRKWSRAEDEKLRELVSRNMPIEDIAIVLGRTYNSVEHRMRRLGLKEKYKGAGQVPGKAIMSAQVKPKTEEVKPHPAPYDYSKLDEYALEVLKILRKAKYPVAEAYLLQRLGVDRLKLLELLSYLDVHGFEIRRIVSGGDVLYTLVRRVEQRPEDLYNVLGKVKFPIILTADWHVGSRGWSEIAYNAFVEDVETYGVNDVLIAGDLLQGRGVHKEEASDVLLWRIDEQERKAVDLLSRLNCRVHLVIGNHESKIRGSIVAGHDPLRAVSMEAKNTTYYGVMAKLEEETTGKTIIMYHGSGSPGYAYSYKLQRHFEKLPERPDILLMGHFHVMNITKHSTGALLVLPGTLQRENGYLISRGLTPTVGWIVVNDWSNGKADLVIRTPKYM